MLTIHQMRQNLVGYELQFMSNVQATDDDIKWGIQYIDALYRTYSDETIRKIYETKIEMESEGSK